jgi:trigger factor
MQVTETLAEGLKRQYRVTVPASELASRLAGELESLKNRVNIPGFRPGKVPVAHLKRMYGKSVMADVVQNTVTEANRKIVEDHQIKLAMEPNVQFPQEQAVLEGVMAATSDLEYTVDVEVLPKITIADHGAVTVEREVAEVPVADVEAAIARMAESSRPYTEKAGEAAAGDRVTVDFIGKINGEPFQGGEGRDIQVVLGSNTFIPGFEDQLIGLKAGDEKVVAITFPTNYAAAHLAGQAAAFDVKATLVEMPGALQITDELAKQFGMEDLAKLTDAVKTSLAGELQAASRRKVKRKLLDQLDTLYRFDVPRSLVEQEFQAIWNNVTSEMKAAAKTFEDENTTEEAAIAEYRRIADRRVRLGLVLAEIGEKASVTVTEDELTQGLVARARQYPGQEKEVWEFYRKNPDQLATIRAPIFEEKVVDHLLGQVTVTEKTVSKEALLREDDSDDVAAVPAGDGADATAAPESKPAAKKTAAKKKAE